MSTGKSLGFAEDSKLVSIVLSDGWKVPLSLLLWPVEPRLHVAVQNHTNTLQAGETPFLQIPSRFDPRYCCCEVSEYYKRRGVCGPDATTPSVSNTFGGHGYKQKRSRTVYIRAVARQTTETNARIEARGDSQSVARYDRSR